jgi:Fe-S-cluster containining protein
MEPIENIDAGDFEVWLQSVLLSFKTGAEIDVPCGHCRGCCSAGRFVHLTPSDQSAHSVIPKQLLHRAPEMPKGYAIMGYLSGGLCPMLKAGNCSIYQNRPSTCRAFDCRILAVAGLHIEGQWNERINNRVRAWQFSFLSEEGRQRYKAINNAAAFIKNNPTAFPNNRAPSDSATIAVLAIKVHSVFLSQSGKASLSEIASQIISASRGFEEGQS